MTLTAIFHDIFVFLTLVLRSANGFEIEAHIGGFDGTLRPDVRQLVAHAAPSTASGAERLSSASATVPDGPYLHHAVTRRAGQAWLELDLTVTNGEMHGPRSPHVFDRWLQLDVPVDMALVPRFDWIHVESLAAGSYRVDLGGDLFQGMLLELPLALVPHELLLADGSPGPQLAYQLEHLPWLGDGPGFVENLPLLPADPADASNITFRTDGLPFLEAAYVDYDYGAAAGGASIRFDFGAEFAWMDRLDVYRMMKRWSWEIHRRPQRCYLTFDGEPLRPADAPVGFQFLIGPSEYMISNYVSASFGFDEVWIAQNLAALKGTIDLQHGPRWFGPDAYLAQRFDCPSSRRMVARMAAAARLVAPNALDVHPGDLNRGLGWNAVLQATSVLTNDDQDARLWLRRFVATCERDQSAFGGLCAWTTNKEATDYAPQYVSMATGVPIGDVPIVPVTQPYQETVLAWGLWCAEQVGITTGPHLLDDLVHFICETCREPGSGRPWYRVGVDGQRLSSNADGFYHGAALALGLARDLPGNDQWLADHDATAPVVFGPPAGPNFERWRNQWHLRGLR
ncbi:hypothetical protein Pla163_03990 [Planctomycetes bacterium Pla163]|uniref:Uncharacterized protein n=1 Tax=Rohdeia mirabilis TaxID=2528008 RepID=A0A518CVQ0_9BACT|nr:hypothetical protein Pla163_03990 [Planctomycetes bacterium Pla163]